VISEFYPNIANNHQQANEELKTRSSQDKMEKDPANDLSSSLASGPNDTMYETIAVVDDEQDILELVSLHLKKNHFNVREFSDGSSFIKYLDSKQPDLVVLDLMLPDADGFEICKYMNRKKNLSYITLKHA
jgi:PleD family two-component response regulator